MCWFHFHSYQFQQLLHHSYLFLINIFTQNKERSRKSILQAITPDASNKYSRLEGATIKLSVCESFLSRRFSSVHFFYFCVIKAIYFNIFFQAGENISTKRKRINKNLQLLSGLKVEFVGNVSIKISRAWLITSVQPPVLTKLELDSAFHPRFGKYNNFLKFVSSLNDRHEARFGINMAIHLSRSRAQSSNNWIRWPAYNQSVPS